MGAACAVMRRQALLDTVDQVIFTRGREIARKEVAVDQVNGARSMSPRALVAGIGVECNVCSVVGRI